MTDKRAALVQLGWPTAVIDAFLAGQDRVLPEPGTTFDEPLLRSIDTSDIIVDVSAPFIASGARVDVEKFR